MLQSKVFGKILWRKLRFRRSLLFARIQFSSVGRWKGVGWGWALIRINTVNWSDANAVIIIFNYENLLYVSFFIPRFKYMKFIYSSSHCSLLVEIMRHYLAQNARCRWGFLEGANVGASKFWYFYRRSKINTAKQALFNFNFATSHKVQLDGTGGVTLWRRKGRPRRANTLTILMSGNWNISLSCKLRRQSLRKITPLKFSSLQRKESRRECWRKEKKNQAIRMEQVSTACSGVQNNY